MRNVAIIAPDFPPSSLPPALRMRLFAQHLHAFSWHPIVISPESRYYETPVDHENERLIPGSVEVIRTCALSACFTRKLGFSDIGLRSLWHQGLALSRLCRRVRIDLVFISVPPNPTMILGRIAHALSGVPYVIDYQDPVATDYYWKLPRSQRPPKYLMAYTFGRVTERIALRRVAQIVGVSKGTNDEVLGRHRWLQPNQATEIPFGGEPADFEYLRLHPRKNYIFDPNDGLRHISYIGGYTVSMEPVIRALFRGLRKVRRDDPKLLNSVRIHFVGTRYQEGLCRDCAIQRIAAECGVVDIVEEHPARVPYLDALNLLLQSDGLLAVGSVEPHYTASKIFQNVLSARPLFGIFHEESSVVRILADTQAGTVITFRDQSTLDGKVDEIAAGFRQLFARPKESRPRVRLQAFESYTSRAMVARLAEVFERAVGTPQSGIRALESRHSVDRCCGSGRG